MRRILILVFMLLWLPAAAQAAQVVPEFEIHMGSGESYLPDYPDYASQIGKDLTQDDFDITYQIAGIPNHPNYQFGPDGKLTLAPEVPTGGGCLMVNITYTPKKPGVGQTTIFSCWLYIHEPLKSLRLDKESILMSMEHAGTGVEVVPSYGCNPHWIADVSYDERVVSVSYRDDMPAWNKRFSVIPVSPGKTTLTVTAYNGMQFSIPVEIVPAPVKVEFARSSFTAHQGDIVDLGTDFGNGTTALMPSIDVVVDGMGYSGTHEYPDRYYFPTDAAHFHACTVGHHEITMMTLGGLKGTVIVSVFGDEPCADIRAEAETIYARMPVKIVTCDTSGKTVTVPVEITKGTEIARLEGNRLIASGHGEVELTATNPDGSTCVRTFTVAVTPNTMQLPETVELEIGETYRVDPVFDQGTMPASLRLKEQDCTEQNLYTTRYEGTTITAQAPGKAIYTVTAGDLSHTLTIVVPDSDEAVSIIIPEQPFPMGRSCQLSVMDRAGRRYPAKFSTFMSADYGTLTEDGFFTARMDCYFDVSADLEDGRHLSTMIEVRKLPMWLRHGAVILRMSETLYLSYAMSDVGAINGLELEYEVADERVVRLENDTLYPVRFGTATVKVTSKLTGVSTTFMVEVIGDTSTEYVGMTTMTVPYGGARRLPVLMENGKELTINWRITHNDPGAGNSQASGFELEGDMISCTWPTARCELTGTIKGTSKKVRVTVNGYLIPETIWIEPEVTRLEIGDILQLAVRHDDPGCVVEEVLWYAEPEGVVRMNEYSESTVNTVRAAAPGTAVILAVLENGAYGACVVSVYDPDADTPGDVNMDRLVDAQDALLLMQYSAGWNPEINETLADINADNAIDVQDALVILQSSEAATAGE